jgi:hypothetical protein
MHLKAFDIESEGFKKGISFDMSDSANITLIKPYAKICPKIH